jgi:hypothetical protein
MLGIIFEAIAKRWNAEGLPTLSEKGWQHGKTISLATARRRVSPSTHNFVTYRPYEFYQ